MLPGPDLIYECPQCGNLLKQESLTSGNTFGAKLYSDGKQIAEMLPDFPDLTKCKKCNNIFWIEDLKEIGGYFKWWDAGGYIDEEFKTDDMKAKWEAAEEVTFLDIKDLHVALKITKDIEKEKTIRIWIWQAFNDRVRDGGEKMFVEKEDKDLWEENCCVLLNLLNRDDLNEKLLVAELYRNLGRFEDCIEILNNDESRNINWIKDPMKYLAKKNFTRVFSFQLFHLSEREASLPFFQMRGEWKEKQGDYQGALEDYDKAIFLDDSNPNFYILKAGIYEKLKTPEMALENFDKALSINPDFSDAYINRALFFRRKKRFKEAQKDCEKAISLKPNSFNITTVSEVDIFKYGKVHSVMDVNYVEKGTLFMDVNFSPNKNAEADSNILINAKNLPYFIFRKKQRKPMMSKRFVKFEFALAKCIFYIRTCILRRQIKYVDNAVAQLIIRKV